MKKKLLATLLCVMMLMALLPTTAFAANAASVWIAGVELTSATPYYYNNGTVSAANTGYNAYYNTATGILSLDGLTVTDSTATQTLYVDSENITFKYAICADGDLTINLISNSVVSTTNTTNGYDNIGLGVNGDLTIKGSGSLTATAGGASSDNESYSAGVDVLGSLTISEGILTGNGGTATSDYESYSTGIYVQNDLNVSENASLIGNGGAAIADYSESYGVWAQSNLNISGGSINATGGTATANNENGYSQGIGVYGEFTMSGGTINATGGEAAVSSDGSVYVYSYGIYAQSNNICFSGGNVTAIGGKSNHNSFGIINDGIYDYDTELYSGGSITISGTAIVHAIGGTASDSFGIWCMGNSETFGLGVSNAGTLDAVGGTANDDSYGIYASAGDISFNGNEVKAIGGEAVDRSYGIYSENMNTVIRISGGTLIAKSISINGTKKIAINKTLTRENGIKAQGSTLSDGSNPVEYVDNNHSNYLWVSASNTLTFSPVGGTYTSAQSVTLSCPTPGATIHYTTNGTEPTESSPVFVPEISIPVPSTMTIKAKVFKDGMPVSTTASATYTINQPTTGRSISVLPAANGSITADKQSAKSGETVTLTMMPKEGYKLKSLLILDAFGNDCVQEGFISLSDNKFVMPDMALTVQATFEKISADGLTDEIASMSGTIQFENEIPDDCTSDIRPGTLPDSFTAKEGETARLFEISVFRDNQLYPISENNMTVTIALTDDLLDLDYYRISYLNNENQLVETQDATVNGEYLQFATNHLGNYIVEAGNDPSHTHSFGDAWKSDNTNHWHECDCGEKSDTAAHTYGGWTITKGATATEKGAKERTCSVCGYKETDVIVATGISPQTGDNSNIALCFTLILVSGGILITLGVAKRKHRIH